MPKCPKNRPKSCARDRHISALKTPLLVTIHTLYTIYLYMYYIYIYIYIYSSSSSSSSSSGARSLENGKIRGPFLAFFLVSRHILCRQFIILCYNIMYQMYIYVSSLLNMTTNRTLGSQETTEHFGCMKTKIYRPIYQIYHILYI